MQTDYHIHTNLCKHSDLTLEIIVNQYIKQNFQEIGISDHIPYPLTLNPSDKSRMDFDQLNDYLKNINQVKKEYHDQIKIFAGLESEYLPQYDNYYQKLIQQQNVDYLILGIHNVEDLEWANNLNFHCQTPEQLRRYWNSFEQGMRTGYFIYPVHPDFFMKSYPKWDHHCQELANKICDLALELDFPLGFNINGLWKGKRKISDQFRLKYPIFEFWEIAKAKKVKIILESDVHYQKQLMDQKIIPQTWELLKKWNLSHLVISHLNFAKYFQKNKI